MSTFDEVYEFIRTHPVSAARDLIEALPHINENSIGGALIRMYNQGMLERHKVGRNWVYYVDEPLTAAELKKLTELENLARELEAKKLWRRAATVWLEAYDTASNQTSRNRYAKCRAHCLSGMTHGVTDGSGSAPGNYAGGDL